MLTIQRAVATVALIAGLSDVAVSAEIPKLQYQFEPGKHYGYDITIKVDTELYTEIYTGYGLYRGNSVQDDRMSLTYQGDLKLDFKVKPRVLLPFYTPAQLRASSDDVVIDDRGKVLPPMMFPKPMPYVLGFLETFVIEKLPAEPQNQWKWEDEFTMQESPFPGMGSNPTFPSRKAEEEIDYTITGVQGDLVHIDKKYLMRTGEAKSGGNDSASRARMDGSGTVVFDWRAGVVASIDMNYKLLLKKDDDSRTVTAKVDCRLMNPDPLQRLLAKLEKTRKESSGEAYTARPKKRLSPTERAKLLRGLRSRDPKVIEAALIRLISAPADDRPENFSVPLAEIVRKGRFDLRCKAAQALVHWATPEAEEALAEASRHRGYVVGAAPEDSTPLVNAALDALATIGTESAARVVAERILRPKKKTMEVLKRMGSVAEPAMIELVLTKSSGNVEAHSALEILTEIGGPRSVPALRKAMGSQRTKPMAEAALEAIGEREGLSVEELLAQAPEESAIKPKPRGPSTTGFRTWKDNTGGFEIEAQMVAASDGVITLKKRDGKTVDVPLKRLSQADQDAIAGRAQSQSQSRSASRLPSHAKPRTPAMAAHQEHLRRLQDRLRGVSEDTVIVGGPGGGPFQRVDPRGLPVVGVRCRLGNRAGKPTVDSIDPIYNRINRNPFPVTVMAREGYALGAIQVDADDQVRAVRLAFMKIDGDKLDTTDSYVSDWIGTPTGAEPVVLNGNGKPILGFCGRRAATIDAVGIVLETP